MFPVGSAVLFHGDSLHRGAGKGLQYHPRKENQVAPRKPAPAARAAPHERRDPTPASSITQPGGSGGSRLLLGLFCPPLATHRLPLPPPLAVLGWVLACLNLGGSISTPILCPAGGRGRSKGSRGGRARDYCSALRWGLLPATPAGLSTPAPWILSGCEAMEVPRTEVGIFPAVIPRISLAVTWGRAG